MHQAIETCIRHWQATDDRIHRLLHGRGGCYPGFESVTIDRVDEDVLLVLYAPHEAQWLAAFESAWRAGLPEWRGDLLIQHRYRPGAPVTDRVGTPVRLQRDVTEQGLRYRLELGENQNSGFFPDMAMGRRWLQARAGACRVLNLFAYTCSFSVVALAGGAREVLNVDMAPAVLKRGQRNHDLNGLAAGARFLRLDILKGWSRLRREGLWDLAVVDPPANQSRSFRAVQHYPVLAVKVADLVRPGGEVLFCLNQPFVTVDEFRCWIEGEPRWTFVERLANPPGVQEADPGKGLKVLHYRKSE